MATAKTAEQILTAKLDSSRASTATVIERIQNEQPQDRLVLRPTACFDSSGDELLMRTPHSAEPLTRYSLGQACGNVHFPAAYANDVIVERGPLGRKVIADALTTLYAAEPKERTVGQSRKTIPNRMLVRSVRGRIHGIMSDAYRRLDSRPGVDAFCAAAQQFGAVPIEGTITDTRIAIKAVLPKVFTLGRTRKDVHGDSFKDSVAIGVILRNSDFGAGKYSIAMYLLRVLCLNGMIGEMLLAQTHIGARLEEADFFSKRTLELDSDTMVSATRDYVGAFLSPEGVERTVGLLNDAVGREIDLEHELNSTLKKAMSKDELKAVTAALQSVNEEEMPLGPPSAYRMANALSWVAGKSTDSDRRLDIERLAGDYLKAA